MVAVWRLSFQTKALRPDAAHPKLPRTVHRFPDGAVGVPASDYRHGRRVPGEHGPISGLPAGVLARQNPTLPRSMRTRAGLGGTVSFMTIGRANRRAEREGRARELFGADAGAALDLLELTEFAWHDCYGEITPSDQVVDDIFVVAEGTLAGLARAARLAVEDFRDLRVAADGLRGYRPDQPR